MRCLFLFILLLNSLSSKADVGSFDIIEFESNDIVFYARIWSSGILKNNDLCYYNWNGTYKGEVSTTFDQSVARADSIDLYGHLVKINISKIDREFRDESTLFILKNPIKISKNNLAENFEIVNAYRGNTAGYTYTKSLDETDNIFIEDYQIEKLFSFTDYELCGMSLYGIKDNYNSAMIKELKIKVDILLQKNEYDKFHTLLDQLLHKNIIMVGFCSC